MISSLVVYNQGGLNGVDGEPVNITPSLDDLKSMCARCIGTARMPRERRKPIKGLLKISESAKRTGK